MVTVTHTTLVHFVDSVVPQIITPLPYLDLDGGCVRAVVELAMELAAVKVEHKLTQLARLAAMDTVGIIISS